MLRQAPKSTSNRVAPRWARRWSVAAAALAAFGFGTLVAVPQAAASAPAQPVKVVVLTNSSNGTTNLATKGEEVLVKLTSNGYRWTQAAVVNASANVVLQKISGHVSPDGSSTTTFLVVGYGEASLRAIGNPKCLANGCALPSIVWSANVVSPVVDPPGPATS